MGPLLVAPTLLRLEDGKVKLGVNMRRPGGRQNDEFMESLDRASREIGAETSGRVREAAGRHVGDPHLADTSGPLVTTLLEIYGRQRSAADAKPISIRGGTYARLFPRAVDFGPNLPGEAYTGHAPDESISLSTLDELTGMLSELLWRLALSSR
jgi:acetylornithine deacetylase/succinyl-diaminopimelate desuccinylase-like protein